MIRLRARFGHISAIFRVFTQSLNFVTRLFAKLYFAPHTISFTGKASFAAAAKRPREVQLRPQFIPKCNFGTRRKYSLRLGVSARALFSGSSVTEDPF
jgi:hypothetical protein